MLENRLLDDLDEDLFHELVEVCRANQLDYQPISRGRNQEEYILERHPEIVSLLEQDRQKRIDSVILKSRREIPGETFRVGSSDAPASPLARKSKVVPSGSWKPDPDSPILRAKQSAGDLIFHMDDENALSSGTAVKPGASKSNKKAGHPLTSLSPGLEPNVQASSFNSQLELDGEDSHGMRAALNEHQEGSPLQSSEPQGENSLPGKPTVPVPWGTITTPSSKAGLKDIMAESSATKPSLGTSVGHEGSHARNFSPKLSQKERKRLQQQQQLEASMPEKSSKSSPWQTVGEAESKSSMKSILSSESSQQQDNSISDRTPSKPSMTLRQTVAGAPSPQNKPLNPPKSEIRSVSTPISMPSPLQPSQQQTPLNPTSSSHTESSGTPRSIQTTRHASQHPTPIVSPSNNNTNQPSTSTAAAIPNPSSSSSNQLSLASILYQQQNEKDEIHEAATAKHNLQEIQLEQEFQEWWDQESKRVMEQAEADTAAVAATTSSTTGRHGNAGRGAGGGRGKGKGRGNHHQHNHNRGRGGNTIGEASQSHSNTHDELTTTGSGERRRAEDSTAAGHRDGGGGGNRRGHQHQHQHRGRGGGGHRGGRGGGGKEKTRPQPVP